MQSALIAANTKPARREKGSTVGYAMSILRLLAERENPLGVNAIARELSMAPSSCFKILKSLAEEQFVEIDPATKCYSLGLNAIMVARRALDPTRAFATVRSRLEETAQTYSIAIGLWRAVPPSRIVLIGFAEGTSQMRIHMSLGQRLPMYVGAVGRKIAADLNLSDEQLEAEFNRLRWQAPVSFDEYRQQVHSARTQGYGYDDGNFSPGVKTIAVTVKDETGAVQYGMSGVMFNGQHNEAIRASIASDLIELSNWVRLRLIGTPLR